ncbi:MAG: hypothetical protein C0613_04420 [Desulfobulbaceae bacterium]|nr:MAG: hypothetical protein C0613_04420 [Desulfobulbaceae bacterium]
MPPSTAKKELIRSITAFIADKTRNDFNNLACRLFAYQFEAIPAAGAYYRKCGVTPANLKDFRDIPPIGLNVFKRYELFDGSRCSKTFRTSGTSGKGRGASCFADEDLALMTTSIMANAGATLFADNRTTRFMMLVPSPQEAPDIIMAHGMAEIAATWGTEPPLYAISRGAFLGPEAVAFLKKCIADQMPVTIIGGSFGFVNFVDRLTPELGSLALPPGSRLLDAGGFKGRSRELTRSGFLELMTAFFKLPADHCFNLYGLTELGSQFYSQGQGAKQPPHWTRVRICHPLSLNEVEDGEQGIPLLYDLANVARPLAVLTDDLGRRHASGFDIIGRASGSAPRGCSLSLEEIR